MAEGTGTEEIPGSRQDSDPTLPVKRRITNSAEHMADVGLGSQEHNRRVLVEGSTVGVADIGTILLPVGVYAVKFKITGGSTSDAIRYVADASPTDDASDTTQAANFLTVPASVDETIDLTYKTLLQRALTDNEGWSDWVLYDASSEGVRRFDFQTSVSTDYTIELETA